MANKFYFSTDLELVGHQIELIYRDRKQHTGLNNCHVRRVQKMGASLQ